MRISLRITTLILVLIAHTAMAAIPFDSKLLVYTGDKRGRTDLELKALFDKVLHDKKPIVLFVHGRGDEPEKSLVGTSALVRFFTPVDGQAVKKLEEYGTTVILVSWDSKRGPDSRADRSVPLSKMDMSQDRLGRVLDTLAASLAQLEQEQKTPPPIALLAHSMGTIVVQKYVEARHGWSPRGTRRMFTNVVLSSSDADSGGHAQWVDSIASVENVFVTINDQDIALNESKNEPRSSAPLGLGAGPEVAAAATYVHIFDTKAHEVFAQKRSDIRNFYSAIFAGTNVPLGPVFPGPGRQFRLKPV